MRPRSLEFSILSRNIVSEIKELSFLPSLVFKGEKRKRKLEGKIPRRVLSSFTSFKKK